MNFQVGDKVKSSWYGHGGEDCIFTIKEIKIDSWSPYRNMYFFHEHSIHAWEKQLTLVEPAKKLSLEDFI